MPPDARANDLLHWQTRLLTGDIASVAGSVRAARAQFVSPGVIAVPDRGLGFGRGFLVRDPDGHVMQVIEP
jgi:hypothetical protein